MLQHHPLCNDENGANGLTNQNGANGLTNQMYIDFFEKDGEEIHDLNKENNLSREISSTNKTIIQNIPFGKVPGNKTERKLPRGGSSLTNLFQYNNQFEFKKIRDDQRNKPLRKQQTFDSGIQNIRQPLFDDNESLQRENKYVKKSLSKSLNDLFSDTNMSAVWGSDGKKDGDISESSSNTAYSKIDSNQSNNTSRKPLIKRVLKTNSYDELAGNSNDLAGKKANRSDWVVKINDVKKKQKDSWKHVDNRVNVKSNDRFTHWSSHFKHLKKHHK